MSVCAQSRQDVIRNKRTTMKIYHVILMIVVALSTWPLLAEEAYLSRPLPGQSAPDGYVGASSPELIRGPSSSDMSGWRSKSGVYPLASSDQQNQNLPVVTAGTVIPPDITMQGMGNRLVESTWYTRVDYFHWNERSDGSDFVNEYGTLLTFGYMRRIGMERFHAAVFGATMEYKGYGQYYDDDNNYVLEPLSAATGYIGVLGEYDLHFEPDAWPSLSLFVGIGTRFWIRDLKDGITDYGNESWGYQETWWTFYPYIGVEKKRSLDKGVELYGSGRIGCTAFTYQHASLDDSALYPKVGLTAQLESGIRGQILFISVFSEVMCWGQSDPTRDAVQPYSQLFTIGLKSGFCF
jgi:hypothetical protein